MLVLVLVLLFSGTKWEGDEGDGESEGGGGGDRRRDKERDGEREKKKKKREKRAVERDNFIIKKIIIKLLSQPATMERPQPRHAAGAYLAAKNIYNLSLWL